MQSEEKFGVNICNTEQGELEKNKMNPFLDGAKEMCCSCQKGSLMEWAKNISKN